MKIDSPKTRSHSKKIKVPHFCYFLPTPTCSELSFPLRLCHFPCFFPVSPPSCCVSAYCVRRSWDKVKHAAKKNVLLAVPSLLYAINNYLKFVMQLYFRPATVKMLSNLKAGDRMGWGWEGQRAARRCMCSAHGSCTCDACPPTHDRNQATSHLTIETNQRRMNRPILSRIFIYFFPSTFST